MKSYCSIYNLSLKVRCDNSYLCWCTVFLKAVSSFVLVVSTSFDEFKGRTDRSGGKSITLSSISKYVGVLLVRLILKT